LKGFREFGEKHELIGDIALPILEEAIKEAEKNPSS